MAGARIEIEEYAWQRVTVDGAGTITPGSARARKSAPPAVTVEGAGRAEAWVVAGLKDLILLKSTGSEFAAS